MTRRRRRLYFIASSIVMLGLAAALILNAFQENLVFFHSPSEIAEKEISGERRFRLGGLVEENSVVKGGDGVTISFRVTDTAASVPVRYIFEINAGEVAAFGIEIGDEVRFSNLGLDDQCAA